MKRIKNDPALALLPAPVTLTPEQLMLVASETGATLGTGGGTIGRIIIYGMIQPPPFTMA
jgi:hypothetical protein